MFALQQGDFRWELGDGERVALKAYKVRSDDYAGLGLILTHDCEVEHDKSHHVVVAMVRPLTDLQDVKNVVDGKEEPSDRERVLAGTNRASLYLPGEGYAGLGDLFVDFRRLTAYRQEALRESDKVASMSELFRTRLNVAFYRFLFRHLPGETEEP